MQLHFTIDTATDSQRQLQQIASMLRVLAGDDCATAGAVPATGAGPAPEPEPETPPKPAAKGKANGAAKPAAKANGKAKPAPEPEAEEEEEDEGPDYGAMRLEIRTRFANWAEQVGMVEGKSLLDSFDVTKFSELDNSQLALFSKALAKQEAEL